VGRPALESAPERVLTFVEHDGESYVVTDGDGNALATFGDRQDAVEHLVEEAGEEGVILVYLGPEVIESIDRREALDEADAV